MAAGEFALRMSALSGMAAYAAYLAGAPDLEAALVELKDELRGLISDAAVGLRLATTREEPRDLTAFEVDWFQDTHAALAAR